MFLPNTWFNHRPKIKPYYPYGSLLPVLNAEQLLDTKGLRGLWHEIQTHINLPSAYFNVLYQKTLNHYVEMVQLLPADEEAILGSLLHRGIARATLAVRGITVQQTDADPLTTFAIFTAGLCRDLARVLTRHVVFLIQGEQHNEIDHEWQPLASSMLDCAHYYKLFTPSSTCLELENEAAALLAQTVVAPEGLLWLSSDQALFNDWLLTLRDGQMLAGSRVGLALSLIKQEEVQELCLALESELTIELIEDINSEHADRFYRWLRDAINAGDIKFNTHGLYYSEGLFIIEMELLRHYVEVKQVQVNIEQLRSQVEDLLNILSKDLRHKENTLRRQRLQIADTQQQMLRMKAMAALGLMNPKRALTQVGVLPADWVLKRSQWLSMTQAQTFSRANRALPNLAVSNQSLASHAAPIVRSKNS